MNGMRVWTLLPCIEIFTCYWEQKLVCLIVQARASSRSLPFSCLILFHYFSFSHPAHALQPRSSFLFVSLHVPLLST